MDIRVAWGPQQRYIFKCCVMSSDTTSVYLADFRSQLKALPPGLNNELWQVCWNNESVVTLKHCKKQVGRVLWFSAIFTYCCKYFTLPSVFVKATSRELHLCFILFPFAGRKHQRSASGEKPGLLAHGEVGCLLASMSKRTQEWLDWNTQAISLHCLQTLARRSLILSGRDCRHTHSAHSVVS